MENTQVERIQKLAQASLEQVRDILAYGPGTGTRRVTFRTEIHSPEAWRRIHADALTWSQDLESDHPFSMAWTADVLGLGSAQALARNLARIHAERQKNQEETR